MPQTADLVVSLFMAGMGIAFVVADPRAPTSRALGLGLVLGATATFLNVPFELGYQAGNVRFWSRAFAVFEAAAPIAICAWLLRVRATAGGTSGSCSDAGNGSASTSASGSGWRAAM